MLVKLAERMLEIIREGGYGDLAEECSSDNTKRTYIVLQIGANVAVIFLAILAGVVFVRSYLVPAPLMSDEKPALPLLGSNRSKPEPNTLRGREFPLFNADWRGARKTLVLYLSTTCHFCRESEPFYRRLLETTAGVDDLRIVGVFPQPESAAREHLRRQGLSLRDVYSANLEDFGVSGTPTLLLLDSGGQVIDVWIGKLSAERDGDVISKLTS